MSKTKLVITDTFHLSQIAEELTQPRQDGSAPSKQTALNIIARTVAGPKHDWGYLTGAQDVTVQKGLRAEVPEQLTLLRKSNSPRRRVDRSRPCLALRAKRATLYSAAHAELLTECLTGGFLAIAEEFSTDTDFESGVQCMFDPRAMIAEGDQVEAHPLWGADAGNIRTWGAAYFAASASENLNRLTSDSASEIERQDEINSTFGCSYRAFCFPHALIVAPEDPFSCLEELLGDGAGEIDHDLGNQPFRIFIDETLGATDQIKVLEQLEDFLNRLAAWLNDGDPKATYANITVMLEAGA